MQPLIDFLPVLAFFVAFKLKGMYVATGVLIVATLAQVLVQWLRTRHVSPVLLTSAALVLLFGGLTLAIHDERFIMWKPTVAYLLFATALIVSQFVFHRPLIRGLLGAQIEADERTWNITNLSYALIFVLVAGANLVFVYRFSREAWVNFHTLVGVVLFLALAFLQALWLMKRARPVAPGNAGP